MKYLIHLGILLTSVPILNGCGGIAAMVVNPNSTQMHNYSVSNANQTILKALSQKGYRVNFGTFADLSESEKTITCRLATSVHPPKDERYIDYIKHAFETEFKKAGLFDRNAKTTITATLDDLYGSTTYGDAYWSFEITLHASNGNRLHVVSRYDYESSITAAYACEEMHKTFPLALQKLIHDTLTNEHFHTLIEP